MNGDGNFTQRYGGGLLTVWLQVNSLGWIVASDFQADVVNDSQ
jgi:hypothetical protein